MKKPEDAALPVRMVAPVFCPRLLKPGQVKRFRRPPGALVAFTIACPSCGFIAMHFHEAQQFTELDYALVAMAIPVRCGYCARLITVADGMVSAHG